MAFANVEERLAALEVELARLKVVVEQISQPRDWRSAAGMFTGDVGMQRIFEQARKIRAADRRKAKRRSRSHKARA